MAASPSRPSSLAIALGLALVGCSSSSGGGDASDVGADAATDSAIGFGDVGPGGSDSHDPDACAGSRTTANPVPLDMYLMIDRSASMDETTASTFTKWQALGFALSSFLSNPGASGLGVGEAFFSYQPPGVPLLCQTDADCGVGGSCPPLHFCLTSRGPGNGPVPCAKDADCDTSDRCDVYGYCSGNPRVLCPQEQIGTACSDAGGNNFGTCTAGAYCSNHDSCTAGDYAKPVVAIAPLPGNQNALTKAMKAISPDGSTPTGPALLGAVQYAEGYRAAHPDRKVVVVLATDGVPTTCTPTDVPSIAQIASDARTAGVDTFVLGIYTQADGSLDNLNQIAQAGSGSDAIIVNVGAGDTTASILAALNKIRGAALSCQYVLPTSADADYAKVNVQFTNAGVPSTVTYVASASSCTSTGGWYYDVDPKQGTPTQILVCPSTCTQFGEGSVGATVDIVVGCETVGLQ